MSTDESYLLTINAGSSSIKFDLWLRADEPERSRRGSIIKIGQPDAIFNVDGGSQDESSSQHVEAPDHAAATRILVDWLKNSGLGGQVTAIGHRVVHGGPTFYEPCVITPEVLTELGKLRVFDPEHLPIEIHLVEAIRSLFPDVPQIACFDTAFHHDLPVEARLFAIPRRYSEQGIRRYGFHGLSYSFLVKELARLGGKPATNDRVILAHLGNGVSLAAVHEGRSIDTTMGLTPAGGVPMSTRSGDLDPGLISYLARAEKFDISDFDRLTGFESGLLGLSGSSSDMETLLAHEADDERAAEAIAVFCYQVKKTIGGLAAALGGLDQLVFTGGMGENAPRIRAKICEGLDFLGISLDELRNTDNAELISTTDGQVAVRVIHTDEAWVIARDVLQILKTGDVAKGSNHQ